jgi:hypothetical protein
LPASTHTITHPNPIRKEINKIPFSISGKNRETAERRSVVIARLGKGRMARGEVGLFCRRVVVCSSGMRCGGYKRDQGKINVGHG